MYCAKIASLFLMVSLAACSGQRPPVTTVPQKKIEKAVPITIHNPYGTSVDIELKCGKLKAYQILPAKGSVILWVPTDAARCEIWPKIRFWR